MIEAAVLLIPPREVGSALARLSGEAAGGGTRSPGTVSVWLLPGPSPAVKSKNSDDHYGNDQDNQYGIQVHGQTPSLPNGTPETPA
jgi:hypothetical protein